MRVANRVFIGGLIIVAVLWVGLYVTDLRQRAADATFYRDRVVKSLSGDPRQIDTGALSQWVDRTQRHGDNVWHRTILFLAAGAWVMGWSVLMLIRNEVFWKRRNATGRPADPQAGAVIREARTYGSLLTARTAKAGLHLLPVRPRDLEINFARREVVLRGFKFITVFMGNKREPEITLSFADILGGRIWVNHGHQSLNLRTTAGTVTITDDVQPFPPVASVLLDVAELNRTNPIAYAAALAREPKLKTPWYGWLIFAAALSAVGAFALFLWHLQPR